MSQPGYAISIFAKLLQQSRNFICYKIEISPELFVLFFTELKSWPIEDDNIQSLFRLIADEIVYSVRVRSFCLPDNTHTTVPVGFQVSSISAQCPIFNYCKPFHLSRFMPRIRHIWKWSSNILYFTTTCWRTPASVMKCVKKMLLMQYVKLQFLLVPKIRLRSYSSSASKTVVTLWDGECHNSVDPPSFMQSLVRRKNV